MDMEGQDLSRGLSQVVWSSRRWESGQELVRWGASREAEVGVILKRHHTEVRGSQSYSISLSKHPGALAQRSTSSALLCDLGQAVPPL
jgi:hypothetical protein